MQIFIQLLAIVHVTVIAMHHHQLEKLYSDALTIGTNPCKLYISSYSMHVCSQG